MIRRRCAIYTRKSTEEGLDQEFNSLDAQREACEAYITSQAGEGWRSIRSRYDDGGISGATLDRPALQRLLADIESGKVDVVMVYKVDRLTRALTDFARMVDIFDRHDVAFVSITQQFNTTSSMGRLTLNVLLSFAQFEREVTAERIRDKIAASKKRGMWMGGVVPLGYESVDKRLVINEAEAETVETLFRLYPELGSVRRVREEADRLGLQTKCRKPNNGSRLGGAPFTEGHLYKLLANPIYAGDITHKGNTYPGEHQAIIDRENWIAVQHRLKNNAVKRRNGANSKVPSLLAGLLVDDRDRPMRPSHANKAGRRYRYYVSKPSNTAQDADIWRLPAGAIEAVVIDGICNLLDDRLRLIDALDLVQTSPATLKGMMENASCLHYHIGNSGPAVQRAFLLEVVDRIQVAVDCVSISVRSNVLYARLSGQEDEKTGAARERITHIDIPVSFRRRGVEMKLIITDERVRSPDPDPSLIAAVAQGRQWFNQIRSGDVRSVRELAERHGVNQGDVSRILPLGLLAPDIIEAILAGRQPVGLTATNLKRRRDLPLSWAAQRQLLGFT